MRRLTFVVSMVVFSFSGCKKNLATALENPCNQKQGAGASSDAAAQMGSLYVYRNHQWGPGYSQQVGLILDGQVVGDIASDQFIEIQTTSGNHLLEARFAVETVFAVPKVLSIPVDVGANGQTYVNFDFVGGQLLLQGVSSDQACREISEDCKKAFSRKM